MGMRSALPAILLLAACGPSVGVNADDGTGEPCSGDEPRCDGNLYEICDGDTWQIGDTCELACSPTLGCVECDPAFPNGCDGNTVVTCNADGTTGGVVETCDDGTTCANGECSRSCSADGVDLIYVVDTSNRLLSFDPRVLDSGGDPFTLLGTLNCPASPTPAPGWTDPVAPFSMAVDRNAVAWILYSSGEIFNVDVNNASVCSPTSYVELQNNWLLFGMGFVTDAAGGNTEKLYVGGGSVTADPGGKFGYLDPASLVIQDLGTLPNSGENSPEITGTGAAEAWGFYPGTSSAFVQQISKTDGTAVGNQMSIPGGLGGLVQAWAFAQWGGKFYLFVTTQDGLSSNSTVRRIDKLTGNYEGVIRQNLPYIIVGAGVSTCAPVVVE